MAFIIKRWSQRYFLSFRNFHNCFFTRRWNFQIRVLDENLYLETTISKFQKSFCRGLKVSLQKSSQFRKRKPKVKRFKIFRPFKKAFQNFRTVTNHWKLFQHTLKKTKISKTDRKKIKENILPKSITTKIKKFYKFRNFSRTVPIQKPNKPVTQITFHPPEAPPKRRTWPKQSPYHRQSYLKMENHNQ